jgi:protein ImuB
VKVQGALRLSALDDAARRAGLRAGQSLADARAAVPDLIAVDDDPAADGALIERIADWADRYTPLVALDLPDGLVMDVAASAHLFGGDMGLVEDIAGRVRAQGLSARAAIADTPAAAWAVARFGAEGVVSPGGSEAVAMGFPLAALRLPAETVQALDRVGLKTIGQLAGAPRAPLTARFGPEVWRRLDQLLGQLGEAISPRRPSPALMAERRFFVAILDREEVERVVLSLAHRLAGRLEERGEGARLLELALFRADGAVTRARVGTARPLREPGFVLSLFRERLAALGSEADAGFGYDLIRLSVMEAAPAAPGQGDFHGGADEEEEVAGLVDRLDARLGLGAVRRFVVRDTHQPEMAAGSVPAARADALAIRRAWAAEPAPEPDEPMLRPLRLFARPEPIETVADVPDGPPRRFRWRRALYDVVRAEGPERIGAEWWRSKETATRDYYRIEDGEGRRFWVFRQGLYEETSSPRWFIHGLFA